jgi:CRISPR-associated endonuclease/helicase Cas3
MNKTPERLLAKSWNSDYGPAPPYVYLAQHLKDVHAAALRILDSTGDDQLLAVGLSPEKYRDRFRRIVLLAAAVHDLGKANDHFLGMLAREREVPQGLRHEWATILMLNHLRAWLLPAVGGSQDDFMIAEWAVAGHHPAYNHESPPRVAVAGGGADITFYMGHKDFLAALATLKEFFGLDVPPDTKDVPRHLVGSDNVFEEIAATYRLSQRAWEKIKRTDDRRLVAAAKNCLIAADIAGSALPRNKPHDETRWTWISESFAAKPESDDLQVVVDHRLEANSPRAFQQLVASSTDRITFVKAGCGTGKTLAAYMWAAKNHPTRRLYFCYPTTGTATEGYKDYLFDPEDEQLPTLGAKLFHSRRDVDFELILTAGSDASRPDADAALRLDSLEAWSTPIAVCTVDTVLGLIQNNRRGLFAWPALAQSAFAFDEIHAFDDRLFGALLRFLRDLPGLPVLLMTASLPAAREEALRRVFEPEKIAWNPIRGPAELEQRPRYRKCIDGSNDPLPHVRETIAKGGKVLWVCNTVARVMDAAVRAADLTPRLYHSRFKYEDRVQRHKAVIDAFNPKLNAGAALAICSQVAEMSLDLSADLLVTDLATVPALIQRLGRLNRRAEQGDPTKPFIVVEPENHLPYTPAELDAARSWLLKLPADGISQTLLASAWEQVGDQPPDLVPSAWLDGGPATTVTELREASPGVTVLMEEDLPRVRRVPKDLARLILPMPPPPRALNWQSWPRERGLPIAPKGSIIYDSQRGAEWRRK